MAYAASNLARGAQYSYTPPALYNLTRDEGDATQLTDGDDATMWRSRRTVGWLANSKVIEIEIDLGDAKAIGAVCLRSARRVSAGVFLPRRIDAFGSTDREHYAWLGDLMAGQDLAKDVPSTVRLCSSPFLHSARFVHLLVATQGAFFFSDEIEVLAPDGASDALADAAARRDRPIRKSALKDFALEHEAVSKMAADLAARPATGPGAAEFSEGIAVLAREWRWNRLYELEVHAARRPDHKL